MVNHTQRTGKYVHEPRWWWAGSAAAVCALAVCCGSPRPSSWSHELRFTNSKKMILTSQNAAGPRNIGDRLGDLSKFPSSSKNLVVYSWRIVKNITNSRTWQKLINGIHSKEETLAMLISLPLSPVPCTTLLRMDDFLNHKYRHMLMILFSKVMRRFTVCQCHFQTRWSMEDSVLSLSSLNWSIIIRFWFTWI